MGVDEIIMDIELKHIELQCCDCGCKFIFSKEDQLYYLKKCWKRPKRCSKCGDLKKEEIKFIGNYKTSSYFQNAQTFGPRSNVVDRTNGRSKCIIEVEFSGEIFFVAEKEENYKLVNSIEECTFFPWHKAQEIIHKLVVSEDFKNHILTIKY